MLYHRVAEPLTDPQLLAVSREHFDAQMEIVRRCCRPLSLTALVKALDAGRVPDRGVLVTFDDGYADNLHNAKPLLEKHDVPAAVFVCTGRLDSPRGFWWDEIEQAILHPGTVSCQQSAISDPVHSALSTQQSALGDFTSYTPERFALYRGWNVEEQSDPTPRHTLYRAWHRHVGRLKPEEGELVVEKLARSTQHSAHYTQHSALSTQHSLCRVLSADEVRRLAEGGLVEIGAHTVSHPALGRLPLPEQRKEIEQSKRHLQEILGRSIEHFAYPYGTRNDYSEETAKLVQDLGFKSGSANFADSVRRHTDRYQLPRVVVRNWTPSEFERRLQEWLNHL